MKKGVCKRREKKSLLKKRYIGRQCLHEMIDDLFAIERAQSIGNPEVKSTIRSAFLVLYEFHKSVNKGLKN